MNNIAKDLRLHVRNELEKAKKHFDDDDSFPVNTILPEIIQELGLVDLLIDCGDYCSHEIAISYYRASKLLATFQRPELNKKLALNYYNTNQPHKALKYIDKELLINKNDLDSLELKQSILIKLKMNLEVLFLFEKITHLNPNSCVAYFNRGKVFIEFEFYEKAINSLLKAHELNSSNSEVLYTLYKIYKSVYTNEELAYSYGTLYAKMNGLSYDDL
jgi:tetratricopeptide (TPR) repeat protein